MAADKDPVTRVVFDLSDDAKEFLLGLFGQSTENASTAKSAKTKSPKKEVVEKDDPADAVTTLTQIREAIQLKVEEGKTESIKKLLKKFDAKNATTLEEENYDAFYKAIVKL